MYLVYCLVRAKQSTMLGIAINNSTHSYGCHEVDAIEFTFIILAPYQHKVNVQERVCLF